MLGVLKVTWGWFPVQPALIMLPFGRHCPSDKRIQTKKHVPGTTMQYTTKTPCCSIGTGKRGPCRGPKHPPKGMRLSVECGCSWDPLDTIQVGNHIHQPLSRWFHMHHFPYLLAECSCCIVQSKSWIWADWSNIQNGGCPPQSRFLCKGALGSMPICRATD